MVTMRCSDFVCPRPPISWSPCADKTCAIVAFNVYATPAACKAAKAHLRVCALCFIYRLVCLLRFLKTSTIRTSCEHCCRMQSVGLQGVRANGPSCEARQTWQEIYGKAILRVLRILHCLRKALENHSSNSAFRRIFRQMWQMRRYCVHQNLYR